jgi:hypothetical protein
MLHGLVDSILACIHGFQLLGGMTPIFTTILTCITRNRWHFT